MLDAKNIEEIFLAFVGTGTLVPSCKLLGALAEASGTTEADLHERYKAFAQAMAQTESDPFED